MRALRDFLLDPAPERAPAARHDGAVARPDGPAARHDGAAGSALVDRAAPWRAARPHAAGVPPGVAVLCPAAHARPLGAAVALLLARRARARAGLVVVWRGTHVTGTPPILPALPAARRLAAVLQGRGLEARATGKLVFVNLAADPVEASAAAARALAAAGAAPTVLALAGRDGGFDALLGDQDRVLVATPPTTDDAVRRLAVAGLAPVADDARGCAVAPSTITRLLAGSGMWVPPGLRRALTDAVSGLGG